MPGYNGLKANDRVELISKSEIRNMTDACVRCNGINLSQGVCDLPLEPVIREAACSAIRAGTNCYTNHCGLDELREAIANKVERFNGFPCKPEDIIVSAGATGALYCAAMAILNPGDEVIVFEPYYGYHVNTLRAMGAVPVFCRLEAPDWNLCSTRLKSALSPRTRAILINTPANPSGKVFSTAELITIGEICQSHGLFVFTDEIYEYFTYDNQAHVSPASIPILRDRTITVSGFSKVFSITGWRIGYCIAPECVRTEIGHINDLVYVCAPAPLQAGVAAALNTLGEAFYRSLKEAYEAKRDKLCRALFDARIPPCVPQGAYYILFNADRIPGSDSKTKAIWLLDRCGVATVPGEAFYEHDPVCILRLCFAKDDKTLDAACLRLSALNL